MKNIVLGYMAFLSYVKLWSQICKLWLVYCSLSQVEVRIAWFKPDEQQNVGSYIVDVYVMLQK